jgi:hypothetical protein
LLERYVLCLGNEESIQHLFVDCFYAKEVWSLALDGLLHRFVWPHSCVEYFTQWWKNTMGASSKKLISNRYGRLYLNMFVGVSGCQEIKKNLMMNQGGQDKLYQSPFLAYRIYATSTQLARSIT